MCLTLDSLVMDSSTMLDSWVDGEGDVYGVNETQVSPWWVFDGVIATLLVSVAGNDQIPMLAEEGRGVMARFMADPESTTPRDVGLVKAFFRSTFRIACPGSKEVP